MVHDLWIGLIDDLLNNEGGVYNDDRLVVCILGLFVKMTFLMKFFYMI